jgi:hypothetical protein
MKMFTHPQTDFNDRTWQNSQQERFGANDQSNSGFWYYFPITFLIKTPVALTLFILLGGVLLRRYGAGLAAEAMLLFPACFYFLYSMTTNMNIGNRHILPIYPFLIVFASKAARALDELAPAESGGMQGVYLNDEVAPGVTRFLGRLKRLDPIDRVGHSIFIYGW